MFERVITQTIQRISSEVLRDRQSVPLTEILEDERIPSRFKPFFATEVRWWLYNDALARGANKRFDFAHPELASLLDYLEQVMFRHARFEHDEFVSTLDGAVKLTFNYLCRPQTTLKWYIFRGQPVKPLSEVMLRFESFLDYEYIGNVFAEWVDQKVRERATFEAISATEFERIIRRIDDQILLSCTVDELLGLLDPIFDFIGEGEEQNVPLDALIIFFDDKNIARLVDHLDRYRQPNATVSRARFVGILEELLTSAEENPEADFSSVYQNDELDDIVRRHLEADGKFASQPHDGSEPDSPSGEPPLEEPREEPPPAMPPVEEPPVEEPPVEEPPVEEPPVEEPSVEEPPVDEPPVVESSRSEPSPEPPREEPPTDATANGDPPDVTTTPRSSALTTPLHAPESGTTESFEGMVGRDKGDVATVPVSINDASAIDDVVSRLEESPADLDDVADAADVTDPMPPASFESGLDPMLERKVLKKVFHRDRGAYEEAMRRLAVAETWRDARQILDEVFIRYDVDPYSRTTIRFADSIHARYVPRSIH
jgi:hypothetical protein